MQMLYQLSYAPATTDVTSQLRSANPRRHLALVPSPRNMRGLGADECKAEPLVRKLMIAQSRLPNCVDR